MYIVSFEHVFSITKSCYFLQTADTHFFCNHWTWKSQRHLQNILSRTSNLKGTESESCHGYYRSPAGLPQSLGDSTYHLHFNSLGTCSWGTLCLKSFGKIVPFSQNVLPIISTHWSTALNSITWRPREHLHSFSLWTVAGMLGGHVWVSGRSSVFQQ